MSSHGRGKQYDQNAQDCKFQVGERVLVLLPTSTKKLLTQWQARTISSTEKGWSSNLRGRYVCQNKVAETC